MKNVKPRKLWVAALFTAAFSGVALAGGGAGAPAGNSETYRYNCENGQAVQVRYVLSDPDLRFAPVFAVLRYQGHDYGLAPAVSASGTRYVGLSGIDTDDSDADVASGLEWWEHQGTATLSTYAPLSGETTPLLQNCRIQL